MKAEPPDGIRILTREWDQTSFLSATQQEGIHLQTGNKGVDTNLPVPWFWTSQPKCEK